MKKFSFILATIALSLFAAGCTLFGGQSTNTNTNTAGEPGEEVMAAEEKVVLRMQNNSGQSGTAALTAMAEQTKVVLSLVGGPANVAQPAHIHSQNCASIGGVLYPLTSVTNGVSETVLAVSLANIMSQLPLSINVHKSGEEASVYVACGDIAGNGTNDDAIIIEEGDTVEGDVDVIVDDDNAAEDKDAMMEEVKTFEIDASNFAFSVKEIRVKSGDKVKINLNNSNGFHDWTIDEFNARTSQINAGQSASVEFVADQSGTFEYYCGVGNHRQMGMVGKLIVE